ncbi:hypothetical protein GCM10022410_10730 [Amphibacillus indicireducens]|uniref:Competence protein ComGD n=2 Tax=Amphibacillus indicireducens TaxID=1076330 RepID=A0ABP7VFA9_9BACI
MTLLTMKTNQTGFTLVEVLIILAMIQVIWFFSLYNYDKQPSQLSFDLWYQQFELDLLYLQKQSMATSNNYVIQFTPEQNKYEIRSSPIVPALKRREIPSDWQLSLPTLGNPISFSHTGQLRRPGTIRIETSNEMYFIYFPFGKGRSYYVQNK